jgi:hypothetical protein
MGRVIVKLIQLIHLTETIPGPKVSVVDVNRRPITLYRCICILQLQILVTHQGPSGEILFVKFDCSLEVNDSLMVVASQAVVVADSAASFRSVLVIVKHIVGQVGKLAEVLLDVQDV